MLSRYAHVIDEAETLSMVATPGIQDGKYVRAPLPSRGDRYGGPAPPGRTKTWICTPVFRRCIEEGSASRSASLIQFGSQRRASTYAQGYWSLQKAGAIIIEPSCGLHLAGPGFHASDQIVIAPKTVTSPAA